MKAKLELFLIVGSLLAVLVVGGGAVAANASGPQVFVNCQTFGSSGFGYHESVRPSACVFQGLPNVGAKEWRLSSLTWSGWGTTIAVATGLYHYRHGEYKEGKLVYPVVKARIVLSRIRTGCGGRRFYTSAGDGEQANRLADTCSARAASAVGLLARAASASRSCGSIEEGGFQLQVRTERGHTRCREARHTMHAFLAGEGTEHGGRNAPEAGKYWTLHGGWRCSHVAGGGACDRGGHNYLTAREAISATAGA